ncbi:MAG TPA: carboxypeptidase-like regulatory domain-containing protein, partial [Archangium sp.]
MRSRSGWAVLSLLLLVSGCRNLFVPDPPEKGALDGQIVDGDGQPLVANLELVPEEGEVLTKQSDSTGVFEFTGLLPGRYAFRAYADGYLEQQRTLTIVAQVTRSVGTVRLYSLAQPGADDGTITGQVKIESDADPNGAEVEFSN